MICIKVISIKKSRLANLKFASGFHIVHSKNRDGVVIMFFDHSAKVIRFTVLSSYDGCFVEHGCFEIRSVSPNLATVGTRLKKSPFLVGT